MNVPPLITYPARPIQGGRLELAPPKRGLWYGEPTPIPILISGEGSSRRLRGRLKSKFKLTLRA
jgi:hypothetical protein